MEKWDLYDKNRKYRGVSKRRDEKFLPGDYHIVVHICIFDSNKRMLIQKRNSNKKDWPNLWDLSVAGSAQHKEDSSTCAMREIKEEIGLDVDLSDERPYITIHFKYGFDDYYILKKDLDVDGLLLQKDEVDSIKWADKDEILRLLDEGSFVPYQKSLIQLLFDMIKIRGAHSYYDF